MPPNGYIGQVFRFMDPNGELVSPGAVGYKDDQGNWFYPDNLEQELAYDGDNLVTITVTDGSRVWVKTFDYTGSNVTGISQWVLQA